MSLSFLNLKGFHPGNKINQKKIWIAEQKVKEKELREKEAAAEVKKQAEIYRLKRIAAAKGDRNAVNKLESEGLEFLYAPPPGIGKQEEKESDGEDEAVKEFHRKISGLGQKSDATQRNLERYVGRKPSTNITIKDQVERFPFLKDAPVEGEYANAVKVNFKPMGVQLRNVRCLRCGEWGHQSGDRECSMRNFNPHDAARQAMEDPVTYINKINLSKKQDLVLKKAALPLEMNPEQSMYSILSSEDEDDPEKQFLATLSTKEKKLLLKKLRKNETKLADDHTDKKKKHSKRKKSTTREKDQGSSSKTRDEDDRESRYDKHGKRRRSKTRNDSKKKHKKR